MGLQQSLRPDFRHKAVLLLGANLGNPALSILKAEQLLEKTAGHILRKSPFYHSEPWGKTDQAPFVNRALLLATPLPPETLLRRLLDAERSLGRVRKERWGPRTIDIDILTYGNLRYNSASLSLPHPALPERRFALLPMSSVAPHWRHPVSGKNTLELLQTCPDPLKVWEINP